MSPAAIRRTEREGVDAGGAGEEAGEATGEAAGDAACDGPGETVAEGAGDGDGDRPDAVIPGSAPAGVADRAGVATAAEDRLCGAAADVHASAKHMRPASSSTPNRGPRRPRDTGVVTRVTNSLRSTIRASDHARPVQAPGIAWSHTRRTVALGPELVTFATIGVSRREGGPLSQRSDRPRYFRPRPERVVSSRRRSGIARA